MFDDISQNEGDLVFNCYQRPSRRRDVNPANEVRKSRRVQHIRSTVPRLGKRDAAPLRTTSGSIWGQEKLHFVAS